MDNQTNSKRVILKAGREKSLLRRHPWVFSGAVAQVRGQPDAGATVDVLDEKGNFLGCGAYSPLSQIRVRMWTFEAGEEINGDFLRARLAQALAARQNASELGETDAVRLVHGESDLLPGLIVDRYVDTLVVQFLSCGAERWREEICEALMELSGADCIYERSDADVRALEGLPNRCGVLRGAAPSESLTIREGKLCFSVDVRQGHKTGFYLDQRANRALAGRLAKDKEALDCFCYSGGFTANLLAGGAASILAVDTSTQALDLARHNLTRNNLSLDNVTFQEADVFRLLRELRDRNRRFDLIVLDPPKFASTSSQAERAARGYKDINLLAFKLLRRGGKLLTFSCSGGVSPDLFQKIVAGAALDAGVHAQILARLSQSCDHPIALNFPEGEYLKGLLLGVV